MNPGFDMQPSMMFEGKKLFQIGCRKCDHGLWKIFTNKERFVAVCSNCGHEQPIPPMALENKPDVQAIPAHLIT
jgi:hypothetical protein